MRIATVPLCVLALASLVLPLAAQPVQELGQGWQFVWRELIPPEQQNDAGIRERAAAARPLAPSVHWDIPAAGHPDIPVFGYGTYLRQVSVGADAKGLGLEIGNVSTAARIFWNGQELAHFGRPAETAELTVSQVGTLLVPLPALPPGQDSAWLAVQVANWLDHYPGLQTAPRIGPLATLMAERDMSIATTFMIAAVFLIMAIYHLFLFLFRREEHAGAYFALICLLLSLRVLCTDRLYLSVLTGALPVSVVWAGSYLSFALLVPAFTLFVTNLFRFAINPLIRVVISVVSLAYAVVILASPMSFYTGLLFPFQIFCLAASLVLTIVVLAALFGRRQDAALFSVGFFVVLAATVFDILKTNLQWNLPGLVPSGTVVFVFVLALVLSRKAAQVVRTAERLNRRLQEINGAMIRFVPRAFLKLAGIPEITTVTLGDNHLVTAAVLACRYPVEPGLSENAHGLLQRHNQFLGEAAAIIRTETGTVVSYRHDGLDVIFEQGVAPALKAALAIAALRNPAGCAPGIGIEYGPVLLGLLGETRQMNPVVLSELVQRAEALASLADPLGATILLSLPSALQIKGIEDFQYRKLGNFSLLPGAEPTAVVEFFDADPRPLWQAKRATRKAWELALNQALKGRRAEARQAIEGHLAGFPEDKAAARLFAQITKLP